MDAVDSHQKQVSEEQISDVSETELLMKISAEELKSVLENLVESKLSVLQVTILHKSALMCKAILHCNSCRWIYCQN